MTYGISGDVYARNKFMILKCKLCTYIREITHFQFMIKHSVSINSLQSFIAIHILVFNNKKKENTKNIKE